MKDKKDKIYINGDNIDFFDPNKKLNDIEKNEINKSNIIKIPILFYMIKRDMSRREFANLCGISYEQLDKILDDKIPIEVIEKIEKTIGLNKGDLIRTNSNTIIFD